MPSAASIRTGETLSPARLASRNRNVLCFHDVVDVCAHGELGDELLVIGCQEGLGPGSAQRRTRAEEPYPALEREGLLFLPAAPNAADRPGRLGPYFVAYIWTVILGSPGHRPGLSRIPEGRSHSPRSWLAASFPLTLSTRLIRTRLPQASGEASRIQPGIESRLRVGYHQPEEEVRARRSRFAFSRAR